MSASTVPSPPALPIRVAGGTTAAEALREAGVDLTGPGGAVVVRDPEGLRAVRRGKADGMAANLRGRKMNAT